MRKKRNYSIELITFFGAITIRVRQGINPKNQWVIPALSFLAIRPHQRYSPDMEKRMAVIAVESGSYEKAAALCDITWLTVSDDAVRSLVLRLGELAEKFSASKMLPGAATSEDILIVMADGWNARHRGENWGRNMKDREITERVIAR